MLHQIPEEWTTIMAEAVGKLVDVGAGPTEVVAILCRTAVMTCEIGGLSRSGTRQLFEHIGQSYEAARPEGLPS